jgi:hypothetical protein
MPDAYRHIPVGCVIIVFGSVERLRSIPIGIIKSENAE